MGLRAQSWLMVVWCAFVPAFAVAADKENGRYALLVGVSKYDHSAMSPLQFPEKDATSLAELLKAGGYDVELLLGKAASGKAIRAKLEAIRTKGTADGVILVGLFGHGVEIESRDEQNVTVTEGCFCPYDTKMRVLKDAKGREIFGNDKQAKTEPEPDSLVKLSELMAAFKVAKASHRVLLADCCRTVPNQARGRSFGTGFKAQDLPENTSVLFGCSPNEKAYEHKDWGHGAFTKCLLDEIKTLSANGEVETANLAANIKKKVTELVTTVSPTESQTPKLFATDSVSLQLASATGKSKLPDGKTALGGKPATNTQSKPEEPKPGSSDNGEDATEKFFEDFRSAPNKGLPDGWVHLGDSNRKMLVRQDIGRAHLRTFAPGGREWNSDMHYSENISSVRLPPLTIQGDFFMELSVLSNEPWDGKRAIAITLKNRDDEKLIFRCFEDQTGFIATLPNSDESKPFTLAGSKPYRLRLERKAGIYRVACNSKTLLSHDAADQRIFDACELEISPKILVGSVKIEALTEANVDKPVVEKPEPTKPMKKR